MRKIITGKVYLVGAGPGDPGLLTLKALEVLQKADVVFYDYLANPVLLTYCKSTCKKIYVGKKGQFKSSNQNQINLALIKEAKKNKTVVRLKGGDPFIFGRGGEEAESLAKAKIDFEIIPGVSSAIAVPAYAGIPLTHRDFTSEVTFVTGHERPDLDSKINWKALAQMGTLVFLMPRKHLKEISKKLIECGKPSLTECALISWGTYPKQKTVLSTLKDISKKADEEKILPPSLLVVGKVAGLRKKISWYEKKPLWGKTVILTAPSSIHQNLTDLGAHVIEFPTIEITPSQNLKPLDKAIQDISSYDWLLFTSKTGFTIFWERFTKIHKDIRPLTSVKIAAIGDGTASLIKSHGLWVDLLPDDFRAEGLISKMRKENFEGKKILFPRAKKAREILVNHLKKIKAKADVIETYETRIPQCDSALVRWCDSEIRYRTNAPAHQRTTWILFTSSSTVTHFFKMLGDKKAKDILSQIKIACLGPITEKTIGAYGLTPRFISPQSTFESFLNFFISKI